MNSFTYIRHKQPSWKVNSIHTWPSAKGQQSLHCNQFTACADLFKNIFEELWDTLTRLYYSFGAVWRDFFPVHKAGLRLRGVTPLNDIVASHVGIVIPSEENPVSGSNSLLYSEIIFNKKKGYFTSVNNVNSKVNLMKMSKNYKNYFTVQKF